EKPLGTAHAVYCAKSSLQDKVIVAFSDTLFKADFKLNTESDGILWTKKVEDPSSFGVVKKDGNGYVDGFYEKPQEYVSDEAIIGVYYFRRGEELKQEIEYLLNNKLMVNGEYQLTDALENLRSKGNLFTTSVVTQWYDCGNKISTVTTNREILKYYSRNELIHGTSEVDNSVVIDPCYIGEGVRLKNSVVGPYVSVENNTCIKNSLISNSIIQSDTHLERVNIVNSMIGNNINMEGKPSDLSVGDYTNIKL
ncbi:MAG: sugar phosphate nucleotidyltransferase, partial [Bacteroidota bacterium]